MRISETSSLRDVAFIVCTALDRAGITAVLTGGSAATVYAPSAYQSRDLDFPPGPLSVGGDVVTRWDTLREGDLVLHIPDPTDCCRDRLASFIFWNDRGSLDQAVAVALSQQTRIDFDRIRDWCRRERRVEGFSEFRRGLRLPA